MKKLFKIFGWLLAIIFFLFLGSFSLVLFFSKNHSLPEKADVAIILGAAINTPALYNRSLEGLEIYEQGKVSKLVLSGGRVSDKDVSEAGYMEKVILKNASNSKLKTKISKDFILEESSRNTYENIRNSKEKVPQAKSVVLISDEYHLARASLLAWRMGFDQVYWSSPNSGFYPKKQLYFHYLRETVAILAYLPKFLKG